MAKGVGGPVPRERLSVCVVYEGIKWKVGDITQRKGEGSGYGVLGVASSLDTQGKGIL